MQNENIIHTIQILMCKAQKNPLESTLRSFVPSDFRVGGMRSIKFFFDDFMFPFHLGLKNTLALFGKYIKFTLNLFTLSLRTLSYY